MSDDTAGLGGQLRRYAQGSAAPSAALPRTMPGGGFSGAGSSMTPMRASSRLRWAASRGR